MRLIPVLFLSIATAFAQQPIQISVRNAASLGAAPNPAIAVDSLIQVDPDFSNLPLDQSTLSLTLQPATGSPVTLPIVSPGPFGVEAYVPANLPLGEASVVLSFNGQQSAPALINLTASSFGLFRSAAQNILPDGTVEPNQLTHPAHPGQYVTIRGTGLGRANANAVQVLLGGKPFPVMYAGPAPGLKGVDQINFQVPDDPKVPDGCYVALAVQVGSEWFTMSSNTTTLSTSTTNSACQHPLGLTADQMAKIDAGGSVPAVTINVYALAGPPNVNPLAGPLIFTGILSSFTTPPDGSLPPDMYSRMESASSADFGFSSSSLPLFTEPLYADDAYFACTATNNSLVGAIIGAFGYPTDLGSALTLSSGSKILRLPQTPNFFPVYQASIPNPPATSTPDALPPPFFTPGQWQISSPGSATVKPFQGSALFPPQIRATNFANLTTIDRQRDQTVTWDPTGYSDSDVATLTLSATQSITQGFTTTTSNESVTCRAHASAGQVTVPSSFLAAFAPAASGNPPAFAELRVAPRSNQGVVFPISLADGTTMPGVIRYSFAESWPVTFQ